MAIYLWIAAFIVFIFLAGIRIVRPTHRGPHRAAGAL